MSRSIRPKRQARIPLIGVASVVLAALVIAVVFASFATRDSKPAVPAAAPHFVDVSQGSSKAKERTVVIAGPVSTQEVREEYGPPVLAKVPYLNRLFKNVGYSKVPAKTYLVVSPRVIEPAEENPTPRRR